MKEILFIVIMIGQPCSVWQSPVLGVLTYTNVCCTDTKSAVGESSAAYTDRLSTGIYYGPPASECSFRFSSRDDLNLFLRTHLLPAEAVILERLIRTSKKESDGYRVMHFKQRPVTTPPPPCPQVFDHYETEIVP